MSLILVCHKSNHHAPKILLFRKNLEANANDDEKQADARLWVQLLFAEVLARDEGRDELEGVGDWHCHRNLALRERPKEGGTAHLKENNTLG